MKLIIAEKPSVANSIAKIVNATTSKNGYKTGNGYIVSWCVGHLVTLANPDKYNEKYNDWNIEDLPILPDNFKTEIIKNTSGQYKILKELMLSNDVRELICATDAGREGELIFRLVYEKTGCKKPFKRLWISSMEDEAIKKGLNNLKDGKEFDNLYKSARSRQRADWLSGINLTRLYTKLYDTMLSVGRVQTPTVNLMVKRQEEIDNFKPKTYYKLIANLGKFEAYKRVEEKEKVDEILNKSINSKATIDDIVQEIKKENAPLLYDLTTLQREANRLLGYSAKQTLEIMQNLYEAKLTTYPRTDSRYITKDMEASTKTLIEKLVNDKLYKDITLYDYNLTNVNINKLINDEKVTDHTAILPTNSITLEKFNSIPTTEQNILMLIILRTLIAPYLAYEYKTTKILLSIKEEEFEASGKEVVKEGFKILEKHLKDMLNIKDNSKAEIILPEISKTDIFTVKDMKAEEKLTSPPRLYTEDTLLLAMETAGKIIEDEELKEAIKDSGLGTPATRANIIENIISKGYIERKGKSLIATSKAKSFISLVDDRIKEPELTAEWEKQLLDMEKGLVDEIEFTNNIKTFVKNIVEEAPKNTIKNPVFYKKEIVGICPVCKKDIIENKKAFTCEDRACKFVIWKTIAGKNITKTQAKKLITKGKTDLIKGFKSKKGTTFNAYIVLKPDNTTAFEFN